MMLPEIADGSELSGSTVRRETQSHSISDAAFIPWVSAAALPRPTT